MIPYDKRPESLSEWAEAVERALTPPTNENYRPERLIATANAYSMLAVAAALKEVAGALNRQSGFDPDSVTLVPTPLDEQA